jgi:hypothetical protein
MKKLILTAAALLVTLSIHAQGLVNFQNDSSNLVRHGLKSDAAVVGVDGIMVALYWAPVDNPGTPENEGNVPFIQLGAAVAVPTVPPSLAGRFFGGTRTTGTQSDAGENARFIVKAWEAAYGSTYEIAAAAPPQNGRGSLLGQSNEIITRLGDGIQTPPGSLNVGPNTTAPMLSFSVVPEPSSIALGLIGAGALLLLRRRK